MSAFKRSQAKYVKKPYRATNWPEYEAGLRDRGSLAVWTCEEALKGWGPPQRGQRKPGGQQRYSNCDIETALTVGMVFGLRFRQAGRAQPNLRLDSGEATTQTCREVPHRRRSERRSSPL